MASLHFTDLLPSLVKYKKHHPPTPEGVQDAREAFFQDLATTILQDKPQLLVCAGWMLVLTASFLDRLAAANVPIINLHPALPGGKSKALRFCGSFD